LRIAHAAKDKAMTGPQRKGNELCEACEGKWKITIERDYLAEAFRIAQDRWNRPIQKEHVTAVIKHCRKIVGATMELPEVA
jgi:hypothetical protein